MQDLLLVMLGGSLGAAARYLVGRCCAVLGPEEFPWPTLGINVVGSVILGWLIVWVSGHPERAAWRLLLGTGFCGGFTTFSTFSVETIKLLHDQRPVAAMAYVLSSVVAALLGAWLGSRL